MHNNAIHYNAASFADPQYGDEEGPAGELHVQAPSAMHAPGTPPLKLQRQL